MSESPSNAANQGLPPDQATVKRGLADAQLRGDAVQVAFWQELADELDLPQSSRGLTPGTPS